MVTPDRARLLSELLEELRQTSDDHIPDEAWTAVHTCLFAVPYVELIVIRKGFVFLKQRAEDDTEFPGRPWHIPGGLWRGAWTLDDAVQAIAQRELNTSATLTPNVIHPCFRYPSHSRGRVCSHLIRVVTRDEPQGGQWFAVHDLPVNIVVEHAMFIRQMSGDLVPADRQAIHDALLALPGILAQPRRVPRGGLLKTCT